MKINVVCLTILAAFAGLWQGRAASAQAGDIVLFIRQQDLTRTSDGGVDFLRAANAPLFAESGAVVGTANLTSVVQHPALAYFPIFMELASGERRIFVSRLVSRDAVFRRAFAFEVSGSLPTNFYRASIIAPAELPQGRTPFILSLRQEFFGAPPALSFNHVFDFTSPRIQNSGPGFALSFRATSTWSLADRGIKTRVGENFSFNFSNSTQSGSANFLQLNRQNGAIVISAGLSAVSAVAGVGGFDGIYGNVSSASPADFGVTGDAGSVTAFTQLVAGRQVGIATCPPGFEPPAPTDVLAKLPILTLGQDDARTFISWSSVVCAVQYDVEISSSNGLELVRVNSTNYAFPSPGFTSPSRIRVAAVTAEGVRGEFTSARITGLADALPPR